MALVIKKFPENTYRKIIEGLFFGFSGIFVGITLNDLWRLFDLPGNARASEYADIKQDELYQYMIAVALSISSLIYPIDNKNTNNFFLGIGTAVGVRWANSTERGEPLEIIPK